MKVLIDVTSSCRSVQNTGMQRMTRKIFAELARHAVVGRRGAQCIELLQPISWNNIGNFYQALGELEHRFLARPFEVRSRATARPEWRGHDPITEFSRLISRPRIRLEDEVKDGDVFLVPDIYRDLRRNALPDFLKRTPARTIAIFHDATDLRLTSVYHNRGRKSRPYVESLALFDLVLCVSEEARDDLLFLWNEYGCTATETCVEPWPGELEGAVQQSDGDGRSNLVVYVSSFHARKNHLTLLRAAEKLWQQGLSFELHLIGRNAGPPLNKIVRQIWNLQLRGRPLRWLRHVDDETLLREYRDCRFTVYPSLMEGYGLPIVESLLHGKPCICGDNGALGEVARGGGCLIVDQTSAESLAGGIEQLLQDRQLYARLCDEARARRFRSWADYIDKLLCYLQPASSAPAITPVASH
jgi:glycosyltransferase involved in cell wall biosynthesis